MKIGFVDCLDSRIDAFELFSKMVENQADVQVVRGVATDMLKIPVAAKRLFGSDYADVVVVFAQMSSEAKPLIDLLHSKVIDVELAHSKYVFFCLVYDEEWRTNEQLGNLTNQRLKETLELVVSMQREQEALRPSAPPATGGGMDMFGIPGQAEDESSEREAQDLVGDDDVHSLF
ncbi:MAG: hypothetical protein V1834_01020 [Candidatus Micrarchaeota archaeon]